MKRVFDKNTEVVKVSANAEAYYSGAVASGKIFLPVELYDKHKDKIMSVVVVADELDGKHSEVEAELTATRGTIEKLVIEELEFIFNSVIDDDLDMILTESILEELNEIDREGTNVAAKLNEVVQEVLSSSATQERTVELEKDLTIGSYNVEKGTAVRFLESNIKDILEDFSLEIESEEE